MRVEKQPAKREVVEIDMEGGEEAKQEAQEETKSSSDRLQEFLQSTGQKREQVKYTNPILWQEFVKDNMIIYTDLGCCDICGDPNAVPQRLDTMAGTKAICWPCTRVVLQILEKQQLAENFNKLKMTGQDQK